jgi:hypothetical protein
MHLNADPIDLSSTDKYVFKLACIFHRRIDQWSAFRPNKSSASLQTTNCRCNMTTYDIIFVYYNVLMFIL